MTENIFCDRISSVEPLILAEDIVKRIAIAVKAASIRIWVDVSFFDFDVTYEEDKLLLALLQEKAVAGVDVRLIVWSNTFTGTQRGVDPRVIQFEPNWRNKFAEICPAVKIKLAISPDPLHCHHNKNWIIDGGIFVTGFPLTHKTKIYSKEQIVVELYDNATIVNGGSLYDFLYFFSLRWNSITNQELCYPVGQCETITESQIQLEAPPIASKNPADVIHNVPTRALLTVREGMYDANHFPIQRASGAKELISLLKGCESVREWYLDQIRQSKIAIYMEGQFFFDEDIINALMERADAGVQVLVLNTGRRPTNAYIQGVLAYDLYCQGKQNFDSRYLPVFQALDKCTKHPNVHLTFLAANFTKPADNYSLKIFNAKALGKGNNLVLKVHSKLALFDGTSYTVGSANIIDLSYLKTDGIGHTELNIAIHHQNATRAAFSVILERLLGPAFTPDISVMNFKQQIELLIETANKNRVLWLDGQSIIGQIVGNEREAWLRVNDRMDLQIFSGWM